MDDIKKFIEDKFNIAKINEYGFRQLCGFTFVFQIDIIYIKGMISSASIMPVGIIYKENGEFYFAPLDEVSEIDAIVKEFVEIYLK